MPPVYSIISEDSKSERSNINKYLYIHFITVTSFPSFRSLIHSLPSGQVVHYIPIALIIHRDGHFFHSSHSFHYAHSLPSGQSIHSFHSVPSIHFLRSIPFGHYTQILSKGGLKTSQSIIM